MKRYIDITEFSEMIKRLPDDESVIKLKCEQKDKEADDYTIKFSKHRYESCDSGETYPFVVYNYPFTMDASIIQEDADDGWDPDIACAWEQITEFFGLKPYIET